MAPLGSALVFLVVISACRVDATRSSTEALDRDDPENPDYNLNDEHYPKYLLPSRQPSVDRVEEPTREVADVGDPAYTEEVGKDEPQALPYRQLDNRDIDPNQFNDFMFVAVIAGCSTLAAFAIVSTGYCVYRVHQKQRMAQDVDYPAYGITGPVKNAMGSPPADRKLAQSAQMYHFQHQKQQMIATEKNQQSALPPANRRGSHSEGESDDEDKDYTVYECPGLAPGGQMEVKNPMFNERKTSK